MVQVSLFYLSTAADLMALSPCVTGSNSLHSSPCVHAMHETYAMHSWGLLSAPAPAGQTTTITIQLADSAGDPVTTHYDPALAVTCVPDSSAPPGRTWCDGEPIIRPMGGGLYEVSFITGTIW